MSLIPISIQLYTLRDDASKDFPSVLRFLSETGYVGVEFAGLHGHKPGEIASLLKDLNLKGSSAHVSLPTKENIAEITDTYKTLGSDFLVSGFGPDDFKTMDLVKANAAKFQTAGELARAAGLKFGIHNHWWEFNKLESGELVYDLLLSLAPSAFSELDVYWAKVGGYDPAEVIVKNQAKVDLLHIKDGPAAHGQKMTAVGKGVLDIPSVIHAADPAVTKWLVVELDECGTDMKEAVKDSYSYLVGQGLAAGNK